MRVALLTNIVPPYRLPVFRSLAETPGWQLRVFANAETESDRSWEVDSGGLDIEVVRSISRVRAGRTLHVPLGLLGALFRFGPDVVVSGELGARSLQAAAYCRLLRVPLVLWHYPTFVRSDEVGAVRRALGRWLLGRARTVVGMGREARFTLRSWGVAGARIFDAPNAHDRETFEKALARLELDAVSRDLHAGLGCRPRIALVAGRLFPMKGVEPLLEAWDLVPSELRRDWTLLFVGSGPLAERVHQARDTHLPGEIVHVPAVQPGDLVELYAAADFLVFPSLADPWGLVVNEAMACGTPVLCSTRAGCAEDLLLPGENGWLADPTDSATFARTLAGAMSCGRRRALGEHARRTVSRFTPEAMADGFRRAIRNALEEED